MNPVHPDLLTALDAVTILAPTRYEVLGEPRDVSNQLTAGAAPPLVLALADDLYARVYTRPTRPAGFPADEWARRDLRAALSAANSGRGTWQPGWTIRRVEEPDRVAIDRDGVVFWAPESDLRARDGRIVPGASCRARVGKELRGLTPGFYVALGDQDDDEDAGPLVRFYWHILPDAAAPFVAEATRRLNQAGLAFQLKVPNDPAGYHRADAGVLLLRRRDVRRGGGTLAQLYQAVAAGLRPAVPFFTRKLADGLALALDPPGGASFGHDRCRRVAQALWDSFVACDADRAARLVSAFRQAGLDPRRPYLGPRVRRGASGRFPVGSAIADHPTLPQRSAIAGPTGNLPTASLTPLEASARIGRSICRRAYWDRDGRLCNWISRSGARVSHSDGAVAPVVEALGCDLYGGTAGIALVLARLFALTGEALFRRTAIGAAARSLRQLDRPPPAGVPRLSFWAGHLGVVVAARRVGELTGAGELPARLPDWLDAAAEASTGARAPDWISGGAGAIPALLALGREPGWSSCHAIAVRLGEELCRSAVRRGPRWVWDSVPSSSTAAPRFLTGLAHGAAGVGLALLELHAATGRPAFREAGLGAFASEDALFDPVAGNWPDLREGVSSADGDPAAKFATTWCHGAPGIALTRLRAAAIDPAGAEAHRATARAAVAATLAGLERKLALPRYDASLCHGLAGLGDIVLTAGENLDVPEYRARAEAVGRILIARHADADDWPSGLPYGVPCPSLMLGTAGTGYFLLRLHDPAGVPSLLLPSL